MRAQQTNLPWRKGKQRVASYREDLSSFPLAGQDAGGNADLDVTWRARYWTSRSAASNR